jgi:hypothetical protein
MILNSNNKTKTTWNIVETVMNNSRKSNKTVSMNIDNHLISNPVAVARKLIQKVPENNHLAQKDPLINLNSNFKTPISSLRFK